MRRSARLCRAASLTALAALGACGGASALDGNRSNTITALAVVSNGAETCKVSLSIGGSLYEPIGLPDSLAVVGLKLQITGTIRNVPSTCMIGPQLVLTSAARARN